jgi:mRNA-degrading endonuclease RelE of RelBE toxin-antitoxin system
MDQYTLHIPDEIERQLGRCRVLLRDSIRRRLDEIVKEASSREVKGKPVVPMGPAQRFYVFEGYRVFYQVDPVTHRVVVIKLRAESD